jgi:hypothetical protein
MLKLRPTRGILLNPNLSKLPLQTTLGVLPNQLSSIPAIPGLPGLPPSLPPLTPLFQTIIGHPGPPLTLTMPTSPSQMIPGPIHPLPSSAPPHQASSAAKVKPAQPPAPAPPKQHRPLHRKSHRKSKSKSSRASILHASR